MAKVKVSKAQMAVLERMRSGRAVTYWENWNTAFFSNNSRLTAAGADIVNVSVFKALLKKELVKPSGGSDYVLSDTGRALVEQTAGEGR